MSDQPTKITVKETPRVIQIRWMMGQSRRRGFACSSGTDRVRLGKILVHEVARVAWRVVLENSEDGVALSLVERLRLEVEGVEVDMPNASRRGFLLGSTEEVGAHSTSAMCIIHPEQVDVQPLPPRQPDESADDLSRPIARREHQWLESG